MDATYHLLISVHRQEKTRKALVPYCQFGIFLMLGAGKNLVFSYDQCCQSRKLILFVSDLVIMLSALQVGWNTTLGWESLLSRVEMNCTYD